VDPRRGQHTVNLRENDQYGKKSFIQQREWQTLPIFIIENASAQYRELTEISRKLLYGSLISPAEQKKFESLFNELHFFETIRIGKSDRERGLFVKRWNTATKSCYRMYTRRDTDTQAIKLAIKRHHQDKRTKKTL
jgi:hypothetical protein